MSADRNRLAKSQSIGRARAPTCHVRFLRRKSNSLRPSREIASAGGNACNALFVSPNLVPNPLISLSFSSPGIKSPSDRALLIYIVRGASGVFHPLPAVDGNIDEQEESLNQCS